MVVRVNASVADDIWKRFPIFPFDLLLYNLFNNDTVVFKAFSYFPNIVSKSSATKFVACEKGLTLGQSKLSAHKGEGLTLGPSKLSAHKGEGFRDIFNVDVFDYCSCGN